jgi:septal ring factor EnvC (AmiA/AmiB activator)
MSARPRTAATILAALLLGGGPAVRGQAPAATPVPLTRAEPAQADAQARRAHDRIRALQRESEALAARERTLLGDLRRLEIERDLRREEHGQAARDLARIVRELDALGAKMTALDREARFQLPNLSQRLAELYKLGNAGYVRLLLNVSDLREMGRAYRFVSALQAIDRQRAREFERTMTDLRAAQAALEAQRTNQTAVHARLTAARDAAVSAAARVTAMINDIDARRDLNAQFVGELEAAHQRLQDAVSGLAPGGSEAAALALPLAPFKGDLDWPVTGSLVTAFGRRTDARFRTAIASNGIVLEAPAATPVLAIHEGTVAFAEPFTGFGNLVILDHGSLAFSLYGHLAAVDVAVGAHVSRGQPVGTVGALIDGTPALYFELRIDAKPVDPLQWLRKH